MFGILKKPKLKRMFWNTNRIWHFLLKIMMHLIFYRKIAELAQKNLKANGQLYFEINQYLGKEMIDLLESMGFVEVVLRKDIYGNDRMIMATKLN
jgi:methylase of polypeptide subunit release factors